MELEKIQYPVSPTVPKLVLDNLLAAIENGKIRVGQELPPERELADKRLRLSNAGNIADAALEINDCFRSAQNAAEQYLNEIKAIREETEAERQRILAEAEAEASKIIAGSREKPRNDNSAIESILNEYLHNHSGNG